jgi:ribosomal protein S18 acetylase RimI-like enzyme
VLLEQKLEHLEASEDRQRCVDYSLAKISDLETAARIFVQSFPRRVNKWFSKERQARQFYHDLLELMLMAHPRTFFVARQNDAVVGFLILTLPGTSLGRALLRNRFVLHLAARYAGGRYGLSLSLFTTALRSVVAAPFSRKAGAHKDPHVYVVAVDKDHTGKGIGSALIEQAKVASRNKFPRLMLYVDVDNVGATRLYERTGFRIVKSDSFQHEMVCDF